MLIRSDFFSFRQHVFCQIAFCNRDINFRDKSSTRNLYGAPCAIISPKFRVLDTANLRKIPPSTTKQYHTMNMQCVNATSRWRSAGLQTVAGSTNPRQVRRQTGTRTDDGGDHTIVGGRLDEWFPFPYTIIGAPYVGFIVCIGAVKILRFFQKIGF